MTDLYLPAPLPGLCASFPIVRKAKGTPIPTVKWSQLSPGDHRRGPPGCEYAITTGNGFFVVDLDCKAPGVDGHDSLEALEKKHGETLPDTYLTETRTGGTHLYYRLKPGDVVRNAVGFRPGIDIRGLGGIVVAYPSPDAHKPMAECPPWFLRLLRTDHPTTAAHVPLTEPIEGKTTIDLLTDLKGTKGPYADGLRRAAAGERFVRAKGGDAGPKRSEGVDDYITRMVQYYAGLGDWAWVQGHEAIGLLAPAFSLLEDDDRRAGNDVYDLDKWVRSYDNAALRVRAEKAADRALADALMRGQHEAETEGPKILQFRSSYYLQDDDLGYAGPFTEKEVWAQARDREVFPVVAPAKTGTRRLVPQEMVERFGQGGALNGVVQDLSLQVSMLEDGTLNAACCVRPHIEAEHDARIHEWLTELGGEPLVDWLSILTELQEAAPALWLAGAKGVGKSLLARGCAQVYGRTSPVSMTKAMGRFNDAIAQCPVVFGDEEVPRDFRGEPQLDVLKQIITDTARDVETKGLPVTPLRGAIRVILASNNMNLIHTKRFLTPQDAEALQDRFVHIEVDDKARRVLEGLPIQREWIDGGKLARHITWILENHPRPKRDRLRMPAYADKLGAMLLTQAGDAFFVCRALCYWILGKHQVQRNTEGVVMDNGEVYCSVEGVKSLVRQSDADARINDRQLGVTLSKITDGEKMFDTNRLRHVRWDALIEWARRDGWVSAEDLEKVRQG